MIRGIVLVFIFNLYIVDANAQLRSSDFIDSLEFKLNYWKQDSLGCDDLREKLQFEFWRKLPRYIEADTALALILLGKPNEVKYNSEQQLSFIYYFNVDCKNTSKKHFYKGNFIVVYDLKNNFIGIFTEM